MNVQWPSCAGCGKQHSVTKGTTWWTFSKYLGPRPAETLGMTLTGYYCPACSIAIYDEPDGFENAVQVAKVTARLTK